MKIACLVINPITVSTFGFFCNCLSAGRDSDSIKAPKIVLSLFSQMVLFKFRPNGFQNVDFCSPVFKGWSSLFHLNVDSGFIWFLSCCIEKLEVF